MSAHPAKEFGNQSTNEHSMSGLLKSLIGEREGLIGVDKLLQPGRDLTEETIVVLKKQEHDYLIARVGLQGTLWGAWACLIVIALIIVSPIFSERIVVEGWQVVVIVASMIGAVVFYGTFIFKRALTATGTVGKTAFSVAAPQILEIEREKTVAEAQKRAARAEIQTDS